MARWRREMINNLGKFLRTMRVERDERLLDMAEKIGVSVAFLSAIETDRKEPPVEIVERIAKAYSLNTKQRIQLEVAVFDSRKTFKLEPQGAVAQDTVAMLARRLNRIGPEAHKKIQAILRKEEEK
jgi:HTH-type transcriptional regulator, competence development regulator